MTEDRKNRTLKKLSDIRASDIMVFNPLSTSLDEKISATELLMLRKSVGGLPVLDDQNHVIGIITQRDIRLARFAMSLDYTQVKDLMTKEPIVVHKDTSLKIILKTMFDHKVERLPVVDESNKLIGLILQQEILKKLLEYL